MKRIVAVVLVAAAVSGCGGTTGGTATVWVTRDRGAHVLLTTKVPAGLTAMQALERIAHVQTRYAGRFVQGIDGVEGSLAKQQDWFYFINGYEADRGAGEYRLHPGDVEWWDYRSWKNAMREPVVIGAFPEPFVHGYDGKRLPAAVLYDDPALASTARRLARIVHAQTVVQAGSLMPKVNVLEVKRGRPGAWVSDDGAGNPGDPIRVMISGIGRQLAANPNALRFRYTLP